MPVPLDDFPVHQAPLSMEHMVSSDRNAYDRYYFNAHDRTGDIFLLTGYGVYPNLGVTDAFVTVRRGDDQVTVRTSDALDQDRLHPHVGPYRIEVIEPLQELRVVCDADEHGIGMDLRWRGSFPAVDEVPHLMRQNRKVILDAQRFAQVGTWEGVLRVDGDEIEVTPDRWLGTRDRSWGIRPVGDSEPPGRWGEEPDAGFGLWWTYVPLRFDDFAIVIIVQEEGDGFRILNEATRVWPAESGRGIDQLGWPELDIHYRPGTRMPTGATIALSDRGRPLTLEVEALSYIALNAGPGYGGDPEWTHGQWKGRGYVERSACSLSDPEISGRAPFGVIDHVGRATLDGAEGWGLFEHGSVGLHLPSGFTDFFSTAP